jgi:hypothetical protein
MVKSRPSFDSGGTIARGVRMLALDDAALCRIMIGATRLPATRGTVRRR